MRVLAILLLLGLTQGLLTIAYEEEMEEDSPVTEAEDSSEDEERASSRSRILHSDDEDEDDDEEEKVKPESESPIRRRRMTMAISQKTLRLGDTGVRLHQNEIVLFKAPNGLYLRGEILSLTAAKIEVKLADGSVTYMSSHSINKLTPDKVPSACAIFRRSKVLVVDGSQYYPGTVLRFFFSVQFDGDSSKRWFPSSALRHLNVGQCGGGVSGGKMPIIRNKRILIRGERGAVWRLAYLVGRVKRTRYRYRLVKYPHEKGTVNNIGNRIISAILVNPRSVSVGQRVLVDKFGNGNDFVPGAVVRIGYLVAYRKPKSKSISRDLMYIEDLRMRPSQPWFVNTRPEVIEDEGIDQVTKGQKLMVTIDESAFETYVIEVKKLGGKRFLYRFKINFNLERPYFTIKEPQPKQTILVQYRTTGIWVRSKLIQLIRGRHRIEAIIAKGYRKYRGILKQGFRKNPNMVVIDEPLDPANMFASLRGIAPIPGRKEKTYHPCTIQRIINKKKIEVVYDESITTVIPASEFRVFPRQSFSTKELMLRYIRKLKHFWIKIGTKRRYKAIVDTIGKRKPYIVVHIVIVKKEITDCTKLVDRADKYLRKLRAGRRLWAQVGCDYYRGTVIRRMPTIGKRSSFNKLKIRFTLSGARAIQKIHYGPLKINISKRYYWGEVVRKSRTGKIFDLTLTARAHRIPRGLRDKMREIQKETARRLRDLFQKGFSLWAKIRGSWAVATRKVKSYPQKKSQTMYFKLRKKRGMRVGQDITAMIENKSVLGTIKRQMGRYVIIKCDVPERLIDLAVRGKRKVIEDESTKANKNPPLRPFLFAWRDVRGNTHLKRVFQVGATAIVEYRGQGNVFQRATILSIHKTEMRVKLLSPGPVTKVMKVSLRDATKALADVPPITPFCVKGLEIAYEVNLKKYGHRTGVFMKAKILKVQRNGRFTIALQKPIPNRFNRRQTKIVRNVSKRRMRAFGLQFTSRAIRQVFNHHKTFYSKKFALLIMNKGYGRKNGKRYKKYFSHPRRISKRMIKRLRRFKLRQIRYGSRGRMVGGHRSVHPKYRVRFRTAHQRRGGLKFRLRRRRKLLRRLRLRGRGLTRKLRRRILTRRRGSRNRKRVLRRRRPQRLRSLRRIRLRGSRRRGHRNSGRVSRKRNRRHRMRMRRGRRGGSRSRSRRARRRRVRMSRLFGRKHRRS